MIGGDRPAWLRRLLRVAAFAVLALLPIVVRVACEGRAELDAAAVARDAGDEAAEVVHLGRALRWRLPGAAHDEQALARLLELAEAAEAEQPVATARALLAYREIRGGLLGTRALVVPHADVLAHVDGRIAALMADGEPEAAVQRLAELRAAPDGSRAGLTLAALAWLGWVLASAWLLLRGIDGQGRFVPGTGTRAGLLVLLMLIAWMLAWRLG